jgi:excisionase family DNA binding protein
MQQYLTLEEAAKALQMSPDELREMAKKKTVRAFQDRGSWRFRLQDIEELARSRGLSSDAELQLGEGAMSGPAAKKPGDSEAIPADFSLDEDEVPIGREKQASDQSPSSRSGRLGKPPHKPGSDSDVRLVMDSEIDFALPDEPKAGPRSEVRKASNRPTADTAPGTKHQDDEVIPLGDEPKAKTGSDSDIRLEESGERKRSELGNITEEIDLDAEQAKLDMQKKEGSGKKSGPRTTMMANQAGLPTSSPFELSDSDLDLDAPTHSGKKVDSDSEFELVPFDESKAPGKGAGELLLPSDEEVSLGSEVSGKGPGQSGINLQNPADSGISLESGGSDEIDLDLNLSLEDSSEERAALKSKEDSSSEFELSLDQASDTDSGSSEFELSLDDASPTSDSSSEFELSLDSGDSIELKTTSEHSDSEFELTLDDEGALAADAEAQDIFEETNFDVPALDESGSEAVALDSDLESSDDFEVSLDEDSGDGSQVVSLEDEEEADATAATVARPRKAPVRSKAVADEESADDFDVGDRKSRKAIDEDEEDEDEELVSAAPPAEWGPLPALLLFPSVIILFVVGLMSIELVRGMWGYHRPSTVGKPVIDSIARIFDDRLPK